MNISQEEFDRLKEIERHAIAVRDINDAGEEYTAETADGATALMNLFNALDDK